MSQVDESWASIPVRGHQCREPMPLEEGCKHRDSMGKGRRSWTERGRPPRPILSRLGDGKNCFLRNGARNQPIVLLVLDPCSFLQVSNGTSLT